MGRQLIRCPGGLYNMFSTNVDDWLAKKPATVRQWINFVRDEAADAAERELREIVGMLEMGEKPYYQFTMTYEEAERQRAAVHGKRRR